jgi:hypothetical protein
MARSQILDDSAERPDRTERTLRRELLTTGISITFALGIGLAVFHAPGIQRGAAAPAHSTVRVVATPAGAVAAPAAAATPTAPVRPATASWVQLPPDYAIPTLALRALAQTDTSSSALILAVYIVGTQADASELEAGLAVVNAIRATVGAPALATSVVVDGPDLDGAIAAFLGHWMPAQVIDLR